MLIPSLPSAISYYDCTLAPLLLQTIIMENFYPSFIALMTCQCIFIMFFIIKNSCCRKTLCISEAVQLWVSEKVGRRGFGINSLAAKFVVCGIDKSGYGRPALMIQQTDRCQHCCVSWTFILGDLSDTAALWKSFSRVMLWHEVTGFEKGMFNSLFSRGTHLKHLLNVGRWNGRWNP